MKVHSRIRLASVLIGMFSASVLACGPLPPTKIADDGTHTGDTGQTLMFDGTDKFCCPDGGQITAYRWVLPSQAYNFEGDDSSQLTCQFSPAGIYELELQVKCSHGVWNTEHPNYPDDNRYLYSVTVQPVLGPWYVKPDGSDADDGRSWETAFRTLQTAIDSAVAGQDIIVRSGTPENPVVYYEQLDLKGKSLTIRSEYPDDWQAVENTIIDAGQQGTAVLYRGTEFGQLTGFTLTGGAPADEAPALHLTMDDQTNPGRDDSGKGRDATLNGPDWVPDGLGGGVLSFDGVDNHLTIKDYPGVVGKAARTCMAWIKTSGTPSTPYAVMSWGKDGQSNRKWVFGMHSSGKVCVYTHSHGILGNTVINDGLWHHIAAVLDNDGSPTLGDVRLYVDGVLQTPTFSGDSRTPIFTETGDFYIGTYDYEDAAGLGAWFQGQMDDVRLYDRAMREGDIQRLIWPGPTAQWELDEEYGTQAHDSSGNAYHGTLINFPASPWTSGYLDGGLTFDGTSYISTSWPGITGGAARSCSAWVKTTATSGAQIVVAWGTQSPDDQARYWQFGLANGKIAVGDMNSYMYGSTMIADGQWHHITAVLDTLASPMTSDVKLYVDGQREVISYSYQTGRLINTGGDTAVLGARFANGNYDYYHGTLDAVRVYDRALSEVEIQELADRAPRLDAQWTLDGDAQDRIGGRSGIANGVVWRDDGIIGQAAQFTGGEMIEVDGYSGVTGAQARTVAAWVKKPGSSVSEMVCAWGKIDTSDAGKGYGLFMMGNYLAVGLCGPYIRGTTDLGDDRWHHIVAVLEESDSPVLGDIKLYIDGHPEPMYRPGDGESDHRATPIQTLEGPLTLGAAWMMPADEMDFAFTGLIDDVRVYNYGLSKAEVLGLYQTRFADGGGIKGHGASPTIEQCIIKDNASQYHGGGIYHLNGTVRHCLFVRNTSDGFGGAVSDAWATIEHCTFVANSAVSGGALSSCSGHILNNILWGNTPDQLVTSSWLSYNCIQDWTQGGAGNISNNPHFWKPAEDNYRLLLSSPCIDAGDPAADYSNEPLPNGGRVNLGVYGNTADAAETVEDKENYDTSGDGIPDWWAIQYGLDPHAHIANQPSPGSQGKLTYVQEYQAGTNPTLYDTSGDGLPDWWAIMYGLDPLDPGNASRISENSDGKLTNREEYLAGTDPTKLSTIEDGLPDWWKIRYGLDPLCYDVADPGSDYDNDGVSNYDEYLNGTHPLHHNTDSMIVEYEYDEYGRLKRQSVRDGQEDPNTCTYSVTEYAYDELGRQWQERKYKNPNSANIQNDMITLTDYDVQGRVTMTVRKADTSVDPDAIEDGDLVVLNRYYVSGAIWQTIQGTYNQNAADTIADPKVTEYMYQDEQLYQVIAPAHGPNPSDRAVTTYYYDAAGHTRKVKEATGHYREIAYDSLGQVIRETAFKSDGTPKMQRRYEFDALGRQIREAVMASAAAPEAQPIQTDIDKVTDYYYDTDGMNRYYPGHLVAKTIYYTENGVPATTFYDYDELEREVIVTDPDENYRSVAYDNMDRIEQIGELFDNPVDGQSDLWVFTKYEYDSSGRLTKLIRVVDGHTQHSTEYHYDAADRKRKEVKPNDVETTFDYNGWGNVIKKVADAAVGGRQQTTEYTYDRLGRQHTITGYTGVGTAGTPQTTTYVYTDLDKVAQIEYPDEETIEYTYYDNGMVETRTDQRGLVTTYAYDAAGTRLLTKTVTQSGIATVESFTYDALGRMDTAEKMQGPNPVSYSDFAYYDSGLLQSEQQTLFGGTPRTVSYAYDPAGHRTSIVYPDGTTEIIRTTTWDGRIDRLSRNATTLVEYEYVGPYVARRAYRGLNGPDVQADYLYDALGRLTAIEVGALAGFVYGYVPAEDNIETMTFTHRDNDPANSFGYDALDRLTNVQYLSDNQDIEDFSAMDNLGNRTGTITQRDGVRHYTTDGLTNRYTAIDSPTQNLFYDLAGNLTQDHNGYYYVYDYENRITRIFKLDGQTEIDVALYAYDALGRRIRKVDAIASEMTVYYYSDNWQVLAEYDGAGAPQAYYVFGNYIDEVLLMHRDAADHYYLHDHLYSPVALLDDDGAVVERYEYDAYGEVQVLSSEFLVLSSSQHGNPYYFTGRELDTLDAGSRKLYHYRHRDYSPDLARFLQQDPHGINPAGGEVNSFSFENQYADGLNIYQYGRSDPINKKDLYGLFAYHGKYIPRGSIRTNISKYQVRNRARSDVMIDFRPVIDIGQYCDEIGFIQIEKTHALKRFPFPDEYNYWQIDDKIPYSESRHWRKGSRVPWAELTDAPGFPLSTRWLHLLEQDFESCAICLRGCEKGAYYGCVRWGHWFGRFDRPNPRGEQDMIVSRYASGRAVSGWLNDDNPIIFIEFEAPRPPSGTFRSIVDKELIKSIGF